MKMKRLTLFLLLFFGWLHAAELPNTGLAQNKYGYYGEGVTFGGYSIMGEWRLCADLFTKFNPDGSVLTENNQSGTYSVTEDGTSIIVNHGFELDSYTILVQGNNGCFQVDHYWTLTDVNVDSHRSCFLCKKTNGIKSYGPNSNSVTITVSVD